MNQPKNGFWNHENQEKTQKISVLSKTDIHQTGCLFFRLTSGFLRELRGFV